VAAGRVVCSARCSSTTESPPLLLLATRSLARSPQPLSVERFFFFSSPLDSFPTPFARACCRTRSQHLFSNTLDAVHCCCAQHLRRSEGTISYRFPSVYNVWPTPADPTVPRPPSPLRPFECVTGPL